MNELRWVQLRSGCTLLALCALVLALAVCTTGPPYALEAAGPFVYPAVVGPAFDRIAILVTVANRSTDDLAVNPTDFLTRDAQRRVYPSNPAATIADMRLAGQSPGLRGILPLPTIMVMSPERSFVKWHQATPPENGLTVTGGFMSPATSSGESTLRQSSPAVSVFARTDADEPAGFAVAADAV